MSRKAKANLAFFQIPQGLKVTYFDPEANDIVSGTLVDVFAADGREVAGRTCLALSLPTGGYRFLFAEEHPTDDVLEAVRGKTALLDLSH